MAVNRGRILVPPNKKPRWSFWHEAIRPAGRSIYSPFPRNDQRHRPPGIPKNG